MTDRSRARLAWSLLALYVVLAGVSVVLGALNGNRDVIVWFAVFLGYPAVGALVASRRAGGAFGWIALAVGLGIGVGAVTNDYGLYALRTDPGSLPGGAYAAWFSSFTWVGFVGLIGVFFVVLFPDGKVPSPRWRPVPWFAAAAMTATAGAIALTPGKVDLPPLTVENPVGIAGAKPFLEVLFWAGLLTLVGCILAAVASIVVRFRRSGDAERQQVKWFMSAVVLTAGLALLAVVANLVSDTLTHVLESLTVFSWATLPIAAGVAILRYRLYDIDLVINRALVFGALATFITAVYVAIVVGVSALVGTAGDPSIVLSIVATAIVAVAFQPARVRAQRWANRLVYGKRATPYEVLAEFSEQAGATVASEDVLPKVARTVAEGTGAARGEVWVRSGSELRLAAAWPDHEADRPRRIALADGRLPALPGADRTVPVRHQNELLGALSVTKARGEALTPAEDKLLNDLAAQAGLVLRNVGLTAELLARLEELTASRQRLVSAQDEERRRLERNLHDGAQQHLVGLKVKLNLAARQAGETPLKRALVSLQADADEAIEALRDLARGIYPPLLAEQGLAAALEAHARKSPLTVEIATDGVARHPQDVEAAVYFCCLEALQNVAKYAGASRAVVHLSEAYGQLRFAVSDDGTGFDPATTARGSGLQNMADRVEALGGTFEVSSAPGNGTTIAGSVPSRTDGAAREARPAAPAVGRTS
jgi:signal transduction histidine kinase